MPGPRAFCQLQQQVFLISVSLSGPRCGRECAKDARIDFKIYYSIFLDVQLPDFQRSVIVEEGRSLNLSCSATGTPTPQVEWRREDGRTINVNGVES